MSSPVLLFVTPWTVALQAPLSMGFSRQEYWHGLPFPSPGDLPTALLSAFASINYPLQASCLENPMERGAWRATVCGVVESRTRLKQHGMHDCLCVSAFIYHISMHHQFINHVSAVHLSAIFVTYASIYMFMYIYTCVLRSSVVSNYL